MHGHTASSARVSAPDSEVHCPSYHPLARTKRAGRLTLKLEPISSLGTNASRCVTLLPIFEFDVDKASTSNPGLVSTRTKASTIDTLIPPPPILLVYLGRWPFSQDTLSPPPILWYVSLLQPSITLSHSSVIPVRRAAYTFAMTTAEQQYAVPLDNEPTDGKRRTAPYTSTRFSFANIV
jgi:hypothetical protein